MKKQKTDIYILFLAAILILSSCGNENAQDNSTIKIATQNWCIKNLNVSNYRNGDAIPQVQDNTKWTSLNTGAWCYYDNKSENGATYGKLYNWYAVNDPRGLAPEGYRIPSDAEWTILTDFLGGEKVAGTKMKNSSGWIDNGNGTNVSGFAALPGGYRGKDGRLFGSLGEDGYWWCSSSDTISPDTWTRGIIGGKDRVYKSFSSKREGLSIRCIRN